MRYSIEAIRGYRDHNNAKRTNPVLSQYREVYTCALRIRRTSGERSTSAMSCRRVRSSDRSVLTSAKWSLAKRTLRPSCTHRSNNLTMHKWSDSVFSSRRQRLSRKALFWNGWGLIKGDLMDNAAATVATVFSVPKQAAANNILPSWGWIGNCASALPKLVKISS